MPLQPPNVQLIEKTAKRFKAVILVGVLGLLISPVPAIYGALNSMTEAGVLRMFWASAWIAGAASLVYLVGRTLAWWYHG